MAQWLALEATKDRNFAGPWAYYSNVPMKVFAGNEAAVPTSFMIEALAQMQAGKARSQDVYAASNTLDVQLPVCRQDCAAGYQSCVGSDGPLEFNPNLVSCNAGYEACSATCAQ
jgi:hypothetical protein